jgi:hypothetical protein
MHEFVLYVGPCVYINWIFEGYCISLAEIYDSSIDIMRCISGPLNHPHSKSDSITAFSVFQIVQEKFASYVRRLLAVVRWRLPPRPARSTGLGSNADGRGPGRTVK